VSTVGGWLAAHADLDYRDREVLLCGAAGLSRAQVLARPERHLEAAVADTLQSWAARRRQGEPVAYILGRREFWGLELAVTPAVLVPRPETELLLEAGLDAIVGWGSNDGRGGIEVLELGTGSGAVAIVLALEAAARGLGVRMAATDVCADALALAAHNARRHGAGVAWRHSDWFANVRGRYHVILSNPPYVAADDPHLETLGHEPRRALEAGADGLQAIRTIITGASGHLEPGGHLLLEHGWDQGAAVRGLLAAAGFTAIDTLSDLAGLERVSRARWLGQAP
jgi:release factor glutamine methyltransferase